MGLTQQPTKIWEIPEPAPFLPEPIPVEEPAQAEPQPELIPEQEPVEVPV